MLDEYLKSKLMSGMDPKFLQNISFVFYMDERPFKQTSKKKLFREAFHKAYTLNDIIECLETTPQKQLSLTYRVVLEEVVVPAELVKRLPNPAVTSEASLTKLIKKTKRSTAYAPYTNHLTQITEKSNFSALNYSRMIEGSLFLGPMQNLTESRHADHINFDSFNYFEDSFKAPVRNGKDTPGMGSPSKKTRQEKKSMADFGLSDFNQIGKYLKGEEPIIKRIDPSKIQSVKPKQEESYQKPSSIKSIENREEPVSNNFEHAINVSQSKETKHSFKYDEGLQMLYDKINSLN